MDIAASIQKINEDIILKIAKELKSTTKSKNLCLAGGVALNCVANGKILEKAGFENIWIQPAAGDAGNALGCALSYIYKYKKENRYVDQMDSMHSAYLGPDFSDDLIEDFLSDLNIKFEKFETNQLSKITSKKLSEGSVVGWFQGRMEYGPRALGNRSILGDPRLEDMQKKMNLKIKNRESFIPFAPAILEGFQQQYFKLNQESQYMLITRKLDDQFLLKVNKNINDSGLNKVNQIRSTLPAITHIDNSCRVQTVKQ